MRKILIIIWFFISSALLYGQNIENALRFSSSNGIITSRAGGLGVAYHGIADDLSAISFNPAGLALIDKGEISFGMGFMINSTETDFLGIKTSLSSNDAYISNFGVVAPFKTQLGNASIGFGYFLESNFNNTMEFGAINPHSTYSNFTARDAYDMGYGLDENFATNLWLADDFYETPIKNGLYQEATISEKGGLHNITGGIAFELTPFLTAGFSLNGKWGKYEYLREYKETDVNGLYQVYDSDSIDGKLRFHDVDFDQLIVDELIDQYISGISAAFGIQGKVSDFMRIGLSVKFPTYYDIEEDYSQNATARFDNNEKFDDRYIFENSYSFVSPWVFSGGMSVHFLGATIAAGFEYTDITQMEFTDALYDLKTLNIAIVKDMTSRIKWGVGAEYEIPLTPVAIRASFSSTSAPYKNDIDGAELITAAFGAGIYLAPNVRMDLLGRWSDYSNMWNIYGSSEDTELVFKRNPLDLGLQLTYRY
ncbi:OmpP1/FadL family transporter [Bacteroidota bacterium]